MMTLAPIAQASPQDRVAVPRADTNRICIADILDLLNDLPSTARTRLEHLFAIHLTAGALSPPAVVPTALAHLVSDPTELSTQTIVRVGNRYSGEETLFNPLRARARVDADTVAAQIAVGLSRGDPFADPLATTAEDVFGRIYGRFCLTAANIAKYDAHHGLVIFSEPHPQRFSVAQIADYLDVAWRWFHAAHAADPSACYPLITWNCLPKSGASIMHGHMHVLLGRARHYAAVEQWRLAELHWAEAGEADIYGSYFAALADAHADLGLTFTAAQAIRGFASLTPRYDREVVLCAPDLHTLAAPLALTLRRLIDVQQMQCFNAAIALPPLGPRQASWQGFPVVARVLDRGNPISAAASFGAIDVYGTNVVSVDPFAVAADLRLTCKEAASSSGAISASRDAICRAVPEYQIISRAGPDAIDRA